MTTTEDALKHVGILGMKWGFRKSEDSGGSSGGGSSSSGGGHTSGSPDAAVTKKPLSDHELGQILKKKKLKDMSNDDIRKLVERVDMETRYNSLHTKNMSTAEKAIREEIETQKKKYIREAVVWVGTAAVAAIKIYMNKKKSGSGNAAAKAASAAGTAIQVVGKAAYFDPYG